MSAPDVQNGRPGRRSKHPTVRLRLVMLRGRTRTQLKTISDEESASKRTSTSRHGIVRAQAIEWLAKETDIRAEISSILSEQRRVEDGRRQALWKSWVYHMASPLTNALVAHLDKKCSHELSKQRRQLYQKYIDYSNNPSNVVSLDFVNLKKYNPFALKDNDCLKVFVPRLRDPLLMKWRERDEEKTFVQSSWPLLEMDLNSQRANKSPSGSIITSSDCSDRNN